MSDVKYGEWQPIETAPKDGTRVLLFMPQRFEAHCGHWQSNIRRWPGFAV